MAQALDIRPLTRAIKTLADPQGDRARRNARARVRGAARELLKALDATFPPPARKVGPKRGSAAIARELKAKGWIMVTPTDGGREILALCARHRWPVRTTVGVGPGMPGWTEMGAWRRDDVRRTVTWIPPWVAFYLPEVAKVNAARKNPTMIAAARSGLLIAGIAGKKGMAYV